ncbi:U3 small nucleolar RNA-associated protein 4 homolog isoform X2 [Anneissia japonica]|uniref:U3 small nucleolar RNA-associated protein 4 homolog isoform X2 n=1 Tax=Anneissia japonica TaxID=1529436 RepID=UPI001425B9C1|nr:U3 small nucleolar RNA-associated protein 4 homolog isoform X2 [Anneissia japonica]XP_033117565.1 U3 small nucleolar RNA-associated protein 4 homolog isoform X2 [Anneissia japonica]
MPLNQERRKRGRKKAKIEEEAMAVDESTTTELKRDDKKEDGTYTVHRVKFFNYQPNAIHCLAYDENRERLAVVRSDGSIEIWNLKHNFNQERIITGSQTSKLDSVAWVNGRLFTTGFQGDITEYDLVKNTAKYSVLYGNASWCLAPNHSGTLLATGSDDGCVRLFDLTTEKVSYDRTMNPQAQRIVSLAWHKSDETIVTGSIDNIKVWNVATGAAVQRITLQRAFKKRENIVWCVAILTDYTIVSGDSTGRTIFWDGRVGTMLKGYTSHRMDILSLCVTKDEKSVFTTGVDPTIVQFSLSVTDGLDGARSWVRSRHITHGHTHDVRAMVIAGNFLVSGGLDTNLVTNPVDVSPGQPQMRTQMEQYKRVYPPFPQKSLIDCAGRAKLLLFQYPYHLEVWKLGSTSITSNKDGESLPVSERPIKILDIQTKGVEQIVCSSISKDGSWIAYSDVDKVKLFHLSLDPPVLQKVACLPTQLCPAHNLLFSPDSSKLFSATSSCSVQILLLDAIQPSLQHTFHAMDNSIVLLGVDSAGKFVAAADVEGTIIVYNVSKFKVHCRLPRYDSQPTALAFSSHAPELFIAYADQMLYEYNIEQKSYSHWSRSLHKCKLHHAWLRRRSKVTRVVYSATNPDIVFLHDVNMLCTIDKSKPLPKAHHQLFKKNLQDFKGQDMGVQGHSFFTNQQFKPLLFLDYLDDDNSLVMVEYPLQRFIENLPPTLKQKKFGT